MANAPILQGKGKVSALKAELESEGEYETYRERRDGEYISDFDSEVQRIAGKP